MPVYPVVDVKEASTIEMNVITVNITDLAPTTVTFTQPAMHVAIATDGEINVSFNSETVDPATCSNYKADEAWAMDLICANLAVEAVGAGDIEVRIQAMRD